MTTALLIGRYQPFHKGHLEVVKKILEDCDKLIIGIGSSQYSGSEDNPFSGEKRKDMIEESLKDEGISPDRYEIILIPDIHDNDKWVDHVKGICPEFDVVYSRNELTQRLFKEASVEVKEQPMYDRHVYNGTLIREKMVVGEDWKDAVPDGTLRVIG